MCLAEYGRADFDPVERAILLDAYIRRQKILAQIQAVEIGKMLFGSKEPKEVSTGEMFSLMGWG